MTITEDEAAGPHDPRTPAPARPRTSLRRTTTIDTHRPEGILGPPVIEARGRDLWTAADGSTTVVDTAHIAADLDGRQHHLVRITSDPEVPEIQALLGAVVGPGFRSKVDRAVPDLRGTGALLYLLLDDLPGATLVAGYAMLHAGAIGDSAPHDEYLDARGDLCAGWAVDATMMQLIKSTGRNPVNRGPVAPPITDGDDDLAFHPTEPLDPHGMRRLRRLDVLTPTEPGAPVPVAVFFRDTHVDGAGTETIVHEYAVDLTVDAATRTVVDIEARAGVLPWRECPGALGSAARLPGRPLAELRPWVRETFVGTTTCTHLNDVLRGVADVDPLLDVVATHAR
ncbi:MAG: DUF2889 domain-containing protein [Actinobacteria bacterium]|nr:DUF2889 domain-containing protein [Actinomycetota bacterium]